MQMMVNYLQFVLSLSSPHNELSTPFPAAPPEGLVRERVGAQEDQEEPDRHVLGGAGRAVGLRLHLQHGRPPAQGGGGGRPVLGEDLGAGDGRAGKDFSARSW